MEVLTLKNWEEGIELSPSTSFYVRNDISSSEFGDLGLKTALRSKLIVIRTQNTITASADFNIKDLTDKFRAIKL